MSQHGSMSPEEVEVGRCNLIAELRDGEAGGMDVSADMVRDLIAVLEASAPVPVDREAIWRLIYAAAIQHLQPSGVADVATTAVLALLSPEETK